MNTLTTGTTYQLCVGVDIAATTATVAWMKPGSKVTRPFTIDQTSQGYAAFQRKIVDTTWKVRAIANGFLSPCDRQPNNDEEFYSSLVLICGTWKVRIKV